MAKATLPTNFTDDILASSMGSKRRYNVINNSDGTISLEDVTTYTQVGSTFGAAQINATNAAANAAADASKIIDDYDTLMANTQAGYMAGALAVKKLNSNLGGKKGYFGTISNGQTIDVGFNIKYLCIDIGPINSKPMIIALMDGTNICANYNSCYYGYTVGSHFTIDGSKLTSLYGTNCKFFAAGE